MSNVQVTSDGTPQGTRILVNGVEMKGVSSLRLDIDAGRPTGELWLQVYGAELDADLENVLITKPMHEGD